jgi:hypothetical protein
MSGRHRRTTESTSFKPIKQVGLAVSIGFPLLVVGVLTLVILLASWVGTATAIWILAAVILIAGIVTSLSNRVV